MNVAFAKMTVHSLLSDFYTDLLELIRFGKLAIEYVLTDINFQQPLKGILQKQDYKQFFMTLSILSAMCEMVIVLPKFDLCLGWMYWACFKKELSKGN